MYRPLNEEDMESKTAQTSQPIHPLLAGRWSPRAIDPNQPLAAETITRILEAARWAPSCANQQPWRFLVFTPEHPEALEKARSCLAGGNYWAKNAPLLIISVARQTWEHNGTSNPHAEHDLGMATENLLLEANSLGLVTHPMAGFDGKRAIELFQIPEGFRPMTALAIGYPGSVETLNEKHQQAEQAPRSRKPLSEIAFFGGWQG
jgi:nitroreductase